MQNLGIISVNLWQILISLANLVIIFLILKRFLWKPVQKVMRERQNMVEAQFAEAEAAEQKAMADKERWEQKLAGADEEAAARIAAADETARHHGERIVADAKEKADGLLRQAQTEVVLERKKAEEDIKKEIAEVGTALAEKMLEREMTDADHDKMIESFLDEMGDAE